MAFKVKVEFDKSAVAEKIILARDVGIVALGTQALKDANFYCRHDSGTLIKSSQTASRPEKGELVWHTPYARRVYYAGVPSKDRNANAELMWAHKAYAEHHNDYEEILERAIKKYV